MSAITAFMPNDAGQRRRSFTTGAFRVTVEARGGDVSDERCAKFAAEVARAVGAVDRPKPMGASVVRRLANGSLYFANQQSKGFASFGYEYGDWLELLTDWDVELTGTGRDEHGSYVIVRPTEVLP